jgi:hypothetical protein
MNAGEIRKLLKGKPDDYEIPIYVAYGDVCSKYVFVRVDGVTTKTPRGILKGPAEPPGICLQLSLVDEDDIAEEMDDECEECGGSGCAVCDPLEEGE